MLYLFAFLAVNAFPEGDIPENNSGDIRATRVPVTPTTEKSFTSMHVTPTTKMPVTSTPVTPTTEMPAISMPVTPLPEPAPEGYMWVTRHDTFWFRPDSITGEIPLDTARLAMPVLLIQTDDQLEVENLNVSVDYGGHGLWPSEAKIVYTYEYLHDGLNFYYNEVEHYCCGSSAVACDLQRRVEQFFRSTDYHTIKGIKLTGTDIEWNFVSEENKGIFGHAHCGSPSSQKSSRTLGYIVGFTIAGFFLLVIAIICVWWYCKKRKAKATDAKNPLVSVGYSAGSWREAEEKC